MGYIHRFSSTLTIYPYVLSDDPTFRRVIEQATWQRQDYNGQIPDSLPRQMVRLNAAEAESACRSRQRAYNPTLSPRKQPTSSAIATANAALASVGSSFSNEVVAYVASGSVAASTLTAYAATWEDWLDYARAHDIQCTLPAPAEPVASYLVARATRDEAKGLGFANTKRRFAAITHFHRVSDVVSPTDSNPILRQVRKAIQNRLGSRKVSKAALNRSHIIDFERRFGSVHLGEYFTPSSVHNLVFTFLYSMMFEACLRFDDMSAPNFGDVIWGEDCLRIFLTDTKTDRERSGQWAFVIADVDLSIAYRLYLKILNIIFGCWLLSPSGFKDQYFKECALPYSEDFPIEGIPMIARWKFFSYSGPGASFGAWLPTPNDKISYIETLNTLKQWAEPLGFKSEDIGTHSLRRGGSSEDAHLNLSDVLTLHHGRWRSKITAAGYLETSAQIAARIKALRANPHLYTVGQ